MKKFFTLVAAALCAMNMMAKDYTGNMVVTVNDAATTKLQNKSITVEKQDNGKYHLSVKNFMFGKMNVGTIDLQDLEAEAGSTNALTEIVYDGDITISPNEDGTGALKGKTMKMSLLAGLSEKVMVADMNINYPELGQDIDVEFLSNGTQIPNSDFEEFHTASVSMPGGEPATSDEPNNWHSFMSASGNPVMVYLAGYAPHTFISDDVRPGSEGKKSVKLLALDMAIAIANGTITTGRMNTGSTTADDTNSNYAWMDTSTTDVDANGDPFYATLVTKPDAIKFWAKFKQGTPNAEHPYATCSAIITDGTRFQEPAPTDVTYTNIVAEARYPKIAETNGEWKEFNIPFEYKNNDLDPKAILVTLSTNADAGKGSDQDELYVDDLSLVYNNDMTSLQYKGENIEWTKTEDYDGEGTFDPKGEKVSLNDLVVKTNGAGAFVVKTWEYDKDWESWEIHISVIAADLSDTKEYCFTGGVKDLEPADPNEVSTGIKNATTITLPSGVQAIYNLAGQQVNDMQKGQVYIVKYTNGQTKKTIKK